MDLNNSLRCPICNCDKFVAKHQATYTYSYKIGNNILDNDNLSFEFDDRENGDSFQYIECENCKTKFPCDFNLNKDQFDFTILQKAIRSDHTDKPEFLG
ncbi:hypothetical protein SH1V18_20060 [Vallitalea longa]|uniref:Uncharacterized protein n=1 Tax=Vallitalea longa TaxID=2936439 RepID=A0A9W5YBB1_9FIRM|nr:hypothetical protein [Vallitalea longa]GKX29526.1 hypothetical protein SH1V18_20060 [Vallitalea longa]